MAAILNWLDSKSWSFVEMNLVTASWKFHLKNVHFFTRYFANRQTSTSNLMVQALECTKGCLSHWSPSCSGGTMLGVFLLHSQEQLCDWQVSAAGHLDAQLQPKARAFKQKHGNCAWRSPTSLTWDLQLRNMREAEASPDAQLPHLAAVPRVQMCARCRWQHGQRAEDGLQPEHGSTSAQVLSASGSSRTAGTF